MVEKELTMSKRLAMILMGAGMLGLVSVAVPLTAVAQPSSTGTSYMSERVCATPAIGYAACEAVQRVAVPTTADPAAGHKPRNNPTPVSYYAPGLQAAYGLSSSAGSAGAGTTVAVVDAYDDPNAYIDLAAYRTDTQNNLGDIAQCPTDTDGVPQLSKTTACFAKVNQDGVETSYPAANASWAEEISLDLDAVSAICPKCNILLVEADSSFFNDLGAAENTAASFGPAAIGNSYAGSEFSSEGSFATGYYSHPGIAVTAASGDSGYGAEFPAAASSVIAVGGTSLRQDANTDAWNQTVWSGTGSGCSAYIAKPAWQKDPGCSNRTVGDVAADADPYTGMEVYDTYQQPGWLVFGGTSLSTQIIAGVYGLVGGLPSSQDLGAGGLYYNGNSLIQFGGANTDLYDVTSGSNGSCTGHGRFANSTLAYLCTGTTGYDGPTGMGTPQGTTAF